MGGTGICVFCALNQLLWQAALVLCSAGVLSMMIGLTATIAAELEQALLASMVDEESQPTGPPPASKYAVRHLQKETLTEERLRQLGASDGVQCAVCRSAFGPRPVSGWALVCWPAHTLHTVMLGAPRALTANIHVVRL